MKTMSGTWVEAVPKTVTEAEIWIETVTDTLGPYLWQPGLNGDDYASF